MIAWWWFLTVGKEGLGVLTGMACLDSRRGGGVFVRATDDTFTHVKNRLFLLLHVIVVFHQTTTIPSRRSR